MSAQQETTADGPLAPTPSTTVNDDQQTQSQSQPHLNQSQSTLENIDTLTQTMFHNIANYLKGELTVTSGDYKLLAALNSVAATKYQEMSDQAKGLTSFMKDLQQKYQDFKPYLEKIDEIDANVTELEKTVVLLDDYSKRLEWKFKNLDKALLQQTKE